MQFELDRAKEILANTPATLTSLLTNVSDEWAMSNEGPETFSPFDVIGHLIHGEETDWIPRARIILDHAEQRSFEPFDRFAMFEKSKGKTLQELLSEFNQRRRESLEELDKLNLTPELLTKRGRHPKLGEVSLAELLSSWVVHDLGHISQVVRVMAKQYTEAVGPWRDYLSILK